MSIFDDNRKKEKEPRFRIIPWGGGGLTASASSSSTSPGTPVHSVQFNNPLGTFAGDANFTYRTDISPNAKIIQAAITHIALNLVGAGNNDLEFPIFKAESADGTGSVCIDPSGDQFSVDCENMLLVQNSSNARYANLGVVDRVTTGRPFITCVGNSGDEILLQSNGSATTNAAIDSKPRAVILSGSGNGGMYIVARDPGSGIKFVTAGNAFANERMSLDNQGNVIVGTAAIATNASNGFLYVPSCAGTPNGTPTSYTGRIPLVVDSTNFKLYGYIGGAWKDLTGA